MKNTITLLAFASLVAAPAFAGGPTKFKLSEYKTVAVQPVLSASDSRGLFESELAASASMLTIKPAQASAAKKASDAFLAGQDQGFGFAGKAQSTDVALLMIGDTLGMLPLAMKIDPAAAKQQAAQLQVVITKIEGKVAPNVTKGLNLALAAAQAGDFETTTKALLVTMAISADSITQGSERPHGYMATGIYAGLATLFVASEQPNQALAELAAPLVMLLEQDASMGGADRTVAAQLKIVAGELASPSPNLGKVVAAIQAMNAVKPD